jgi:hypothetical protein
MGFRLPRAAILGTWTTIPSGGQSWAINYRRGFSSSTTEATGTAPFLRALDDATGIRARMPHGGAETAAHGAVARRTTKGAARNDRAGASRRSCRFGVEANTHFLLITSKDHLQAAQRRAFARHVKCIETMRDRSFGVPAPSRPRCPACGPSVSLLYRRGSPPQARYLFKHALIQDAAYQSLLRSTRQQIHSRIARA